MAFDAGGPTDYSPTASDTRKIVMQFQDSSGWQTLSGLPSCLVGQALNYNGASFSCEAISGGVTSSTVVAALGFSPADGASVTVLISTVNSVSTSVTNLTTSLTALTSTISAITSSQWVTSGTQIYYNTGNVGIGTNSPEGNLHVRGSVNGQADIVFEDPVGSKSQIAGGTYGAAGNSKISFRTQSGGSSFTTKMMIDNRGNVGIGTTSPNATLDVSVSSGSAIGGSLQITNPAVNAVELRFAPSASPSIRYSSIRGINADGNNNIDLAFVTGAGASITEKMRITSTGNLGIGTSAPTGKLDIAWGGAGAIIAGADEFASTRTNNTNKKLKFAMPHYDNSQPGVGIIFSQSVSGSNILNFGGGTNNHNAMSTISFWTSSSPAALLGVERMRIDSNGSVGIGTTNPESILDVVSDAATIQKIRSYANTGTPALELNRALGSSSAPSIVSLNTQLGRLAFKGYDGSSFTLSSSITADVDTSGVSFGVVPGRLRFFTNNASGTSTERLRIDSSGNFGIGTTTPTALLHLNAGTAAGAMFRLQRDVNGVGADFMDLYNPNTTNLTTAHIKITGDTTGTGAASGVTFGRFGGVYEVHDHATRGGAWRMTTYFSGTEYERMRVTSAGFVGIGTSNPTTTLDVNGDIRISGTPYRSAGDIAWTVPSDARLKDVVGKYHRGLREIANIDTIIYKYKLNNPKKADSTREYTGVLAQQVQ